MDFFATGGFQQLFSELNDVHMCATDAVMCSGFYTQSHNMPPFDSVDAKITDCSEYFESSTHGWSLADEVENDFRLGEANQSSERQAHSPSQTLQLLDLNLSQITETNKSHNSNNNNNNNTINQLNESLNPQKSPVLLGNFDVQSFHGFSDTEFSADQYFSNEMADWEERFLDNYIEIPELVEILPEKTPLCTDECELFLKESSKHLKLLRKQRSRNNNHSNHGNTEKAAGYTCSFGSCRKVYAKPAHLKAHLRRHLGEKPYVCNWPNCTWKFSRSDELARHRRSHSGIKPYNCDYCTKSFARSDHLTKHRKVHERRLLAASKAGKVLDGVLSYSILTVRPGRKRKNQIL